ncbi:MAG TPA: SRPBCC family protein [Chthoniobacteraceae bacterium]|nr:SRPBCC family protein [Chthoniobacteraceae bacterium]
MKIYTIEQTQTIRATAEECWAFFSNPANLARITPPHVDFRILSEPLPPTVHEGQMIHYRVKPLAGIPMNWASEITRVRAPECFVDEQRAGPYAMWRHEHGFRDIGGGRMEIRDHVQYALPLGFIGRAVHALVVEQQLKRIFDYREKAAAEIFGS